MLAHSLSPESFVITKPLISSYLSAHRKYQKYLESVKNAKEQDKVSNEMKVQMEKINDTEANREKMIKISESLDNDFASCVKKVEFEKNMIQVSGFKANKLKQQSEELKQDVNKLDEIIEFYKIKKMKLE